MEAVVGDLHASKAFWFGERVFVVKEEDPLPVVIDYSDVWGTLWWCHP